MERRMWTLKSVSGGRSREIVFKGYIHVRKDSHAYTLDIEMNRKRQETIRPEMVIWLGLNYISIRIYKSPNLTPYK